MAKYLTPYEYAGFLYTIHDDGEGLRAEPLPDQHSAARKEKHRRAAIECFRQEYGDRP